MRVPRSGRGLRPGCDRDGLCAGGVCHALPRRARGASGVDAPGPETALASQGGDQPLLVAYDPRVGGLDLWQRDGGGTWSARRLDGGAGANAGMAPAIAASSTKIAIAYELDAPHHVALMTGSTPATLIAIPLDAREGRDPAVAVDPDGHVIVVFGGPEGQGLVMTSDQRGWTSTTIDATPNVGRANALVLEGCALRAFTLRDSVTARGFAFAVHEVTVPLPQ